MFLPNLLVELKLSIAVSLRDREVACSASNVRGFNLKSCVWRAVSSHSSHHPQDVLLSRDLLLHCYNSPFKQGFTVATMSYLQWEKMPQLTQLKGGGPRVVVSTAAFHAKVRGSVPGLGGLKETKMFLPHPRVKVNIVGSLRDREVARRPQTARARISNPVSGGQCHLIHLTILRRFSWPSLAYMCTKVA